jgi:hypothetical protein
MTTIQESLCQALLAGMNHDNNTRRNAETYLSQTLTQQQGAVQAILQIATDSQVRDCFEFNKFLVEPGIQERCKLAGCCFSQADC